MKKKIDECGRVLLPVELRRELGWKTGDFIEIDLEDKSIILTKAISNKNICCICGENIGTIELTNGKVVCEECRKELV